MQICYQQPSHFLRNNPVTKADSYFHISRMPKQYKCPYCWKQCKTQIGVTQHINQSPTCLAIQQEIEISGRKRSNPSAELLDPIESNDDDSFVIGTQRSSRLQDINARKAPCASAIPVVAAIPPRRAESDTEDVFPTGSDTESVPKRPTKTYMTAHR